MFDMEQLDNLMLAETAQRVFARMRVKDYCEVLAELLDDEKYLHLYDRFKPYMFADVFKKFEQNYEEPEAPFPDISMGELMNYAGHLMDLFRKIENPNDAIRAFDAGRDIVTELLLKPLAEL